MEHKNIVATIYLKDGKAVKSPDELDQTYDPIRLAELYAAKPFHIYTVDEYIRLIAEYIQRLRPDMVLERFVSQSPKDLLIAPHWGLKNYEFTNLLANHLRAHNIRQGQFFLKSV